MAKTCAQCGHVLEDTARVCTQCGRPLEQPVPTAAQTMLGFASPLAPKAAPPPPQAQPQQPPPPQAQQPIAAKTMLGFAAPAELLAAAQQQPQPPAQPQPSPATAKTMLGVAVPGIAPLSATAPAPPPQQAPQSLGGTMLGVAVPGIAPLHSQPGAPPPAMTPAPAPVAYEPPPPIVPAPAPLVPEFAPPPPSLVRRRGAPVAIVAVIASILVLGLGVGLLFFSRGAPPLTATAKVSAEGKEQLHLRCEGCPDGTTAAWQGTKATFANKEADLDLPAPLAIGDNAFQIAIDRPGVGRDETVKLILPLAYRIRGDLSGISATPPVVKVDVEAHAGSTVTVDGKPVELDASGKATLSYDVTQETTGAADETRTIERKMPYVVEEKDHKKSNGEVAVRVAVLPLHVDAPGASLVTDEGSVWIAGRTAKGAVVTANGTPLTVAPDGSFEGKVDVQDGAQTITVRAAPAGDAVAKAAPRSATVQVKRVASLDAEAKALDKATALGFDDVAKDPTAAAGKPVAVTGNVIESRVGHHQTVLLVDDKRGCAKGPCMVRVDFGAETALRAGDPIVAYGEVGKPFTTPDGKTLTVVEASLVRKGAKR